jgi:RimJ/RimL family protein N-acetyltransferase
LEICKGFFYLKIMNSEQGFTQSESQTRTVTVAVGATITNFSEQQRGEFADVINTQLRRHPYRMRQLPVKNLEESMAKGRFVFVLGQQQELLACSQIWPLPNNPSVYECGTWLSFANQRYKKGIGALALREAAKLALTLPQTKLVIALVEQQNEKAQEVLQKLGGKLLPGIRESDYVKTSDGQPAMMRVFNITKLGEK